MSSPYLQIWWCNARGRHLIILSVSESILMQLIGCILFKSFWWFWKFQSSAEVSHRGCRPQVEISKNQHTKQEHFSAYSRVYCEDWFASLMLDNIYCLECWFYKTIQSDNCIYLFIYSILWPWCDLQSEIYFGSRNYIWRSLSDFNRILSLCY